MVNMNEHPLIMGVLYADTIFYGQACRRLQTNRYCQQQAFPARNVRILVVTPCWLGGIRSPWRQHPKSTIHDVRGGREVYEWLDTLVAQKGD